MPPPPADGCRRAAYTSGIRRADDIAIGAGDGDARWGAATPAQQLSDYIKALRRRWKLVVLLTLLATATAVGLSLQAEPKYDATAKLLLRPEEPINNLIEGFSQPSIDPERDANTSVALIRLESLAERVRTRLRLDTSPRELLDNVKSEPEGNSDIVAVTVRDTSPERAAAIVNAFVDEYSTFRRTAARASLDEAAGLARRQLEGLPPAERVDAQGRALSERLRQLEIASALQTGGVETVLRAAPPTEKAAPRPLLNAVLGALLGLLFALVAAVVVEFVDRRLKEEDEIASLFGLPVLATIPAGARRSRTGGPVEDPLQRESYGTLAANLRFANVNERLRALMITSPSSGDGKTNVTLGLASALTVMGQRVVAIEADLRRPAFARYLELPTGGGLSAVLAGVAPLEESIVEVSADTLRPVEHGANGGGLSFGILPAGAVPPNPQQMLTSPAMEAVLADVGKIADIVLIDTAPLGTVTDAATLVEDVDGTLVVAKLKWTRRDIARRLLRTLRNLEIRTLGLVITNASRNVDAYYGAEAYIDTGARDDAKVRG